MTMGIGELSGIRGQGSGKRAKDGVILNPEN
jgi:hypothetical protein